LGVKEGRGLYNWADGSSFEGDWSKNMINGSGKYKWSDGRSYEG